MRNITIAFVRLPELVQGIILTIGSAAYLWMLSGKMLLVTAIWMAITIWGGFVLVARVYKHMATLRETEDKLYTDFQTVLEGRKELTLNRERAEYVFNNLYIPDAQEYRHHIIRADTFHLSAVNWSNIMMLGAIGLVFWMANSLGWADTNVAATYSLTLLFLRTPLLSAVGALPTLLTAQVAFNKLNKFALAPFKAEFPRPQAFPNWQTLELRNVTFSYQDNAFSVGPINLTIKRGELLFLIFSTVYGGAAKQQRRYEQLFHRHRYYAFFLTNSHNREKSLKSASPINSISSCQWPRGWWLITPRCWRITLPSAS